MRLGMILDTMQKAMSQDRVDSNMQELDKYRGMYPILRTEQRNAQYVYDCLCGNEIKNFDKLIFKEGQKPDLAEIQKQIKAGGAPVSAPSGGAKDDIPKKSAAEEPVTKSKMPGDEEEKKTAA